MTVVLDQLTVPESGEFKLNIQRSVHIRITAEEARRSVQFWLTTEVSNLIGADSPTLIVGHNRDVWRVPAWIGFPHQGRVGTVGSVDVDVETGEMVHPAQRRQEIEERAGALATLLPAYQPRDSQKTKSSAD